MRKGSYLPRYKCKDCGYEWCRGGRKVVCRKCGSERSPDLVAYGFDGMVRSFAMMQDGEPIQ